MLQPSELTEAMLPEAGYFFDASDLTDDAEGQGRKRVRHLCAPLHGNGRFNFLFQRIFNVCID